MFTCPGCKSNYLSSTSVSAPSSHSRQSSRSSRPQNPKKLPLVLKCGHTVCESCVIKLRSKIPKHRTQCSETDRCLDLVINYKFKLPCPHSDCEIITLIRNSSGDLPVNMYILSYAQMDKGVEIKRSFDDIVAGASGDSQKFDESQNRTTTVGDIGSNSSQNCTVHNRIIEYFCETDDTLICSRCYILGDHKGHTIQSLEDKNKLVLGDIETGIVTAKAVVGQLNLLDKKTSTVISDLKSDMMSHIRNVNESFMNIHTLLQTREAEMIDTVTTAYKTALLSFVDKKEDSFKTKKDLLILLGEATNLLDNTGFVIDGNFVVEKLKQASQIPCIVPKINDETTRGNLQFQGKNLNDLTAAIKSYGEINGSVNAMRLKTFDEAGDEIDEDDQVSIASEKSYPTSDLHSLCSQTSMDVIIESDSESNSEKSAHYDSKKQSADQNVTQLKEKIAMPTLKGAPQQVVVTHINSPCDFFVQLSANKSKLETLSHNMNTWCRKQSSSKYVPKTVERGMMVLARFGVDKLWYRAQVQDVIDTSTTEVGKKLKVKVKYVDFGNEEFVLWKDLRVMQERFTKCPEFSVRCCLHDISPYEKDDEWQFKDSEIFLTMTNSKVLLLNAISVIANVYIVDLICTPTENVTSDGFASIRDMLVFLERAKFCGDTSTSDSKLPMPASKMKTFFKPTALRNGITLNVTVSEMTSPSDLYIIPLGEEYNYFLQMQVEMQELYEDDTGNLYLMHWPREEMLCAVQAKGGKWMRGVVVKVITHQKVVVFLTDLGRTLTVPCHKMRKLMTDFIKLPSQATRCTLKDICPREEDGQDWSKETKHWCQTHVKGTNSIARIVRGGELTEIVLWTEENKNLGTQTVNYRLVKAGLAQSCGLSSISSSAYRSNETKAVSPRMSPSQSPNQARTPPVKRSTLSPSDHSVARDSSASPRQASSKSPLIKTSPKKSKAYRQLSATEFAAHSPDQSSLKSKSNTPPGSDRSKDSVSKSQKSPNTDSHSAASSAYVEVIICNYHSPGSFYIRMQENEVMLKDLMEDLQETYRDMPPDEDKEEWAEDSYCAIRNKEDGKWYRGKVKAMHSMTDIAVEFLDYGFEQRVSSENLRTLQHELGLRLHCAAVRCHLANLISAGSSDAQKWTRTSVEFMADQVKDKKLFLKTEGEPTDQGLPVDIIIEEEIPPTAFDPVRHTHHSLRKMIQEQGLAMEKKVKASGVSPSASIVDVLERKIYTDKEAPIPEGIAPDEEASKDSGNVSSSPQALKEMRSPSNAIELADDCLSDDELDRVTSPTKTLDIPPFPMPSVGEELEVLPTFVDYSCVIFAQPLNWESAIVHLTEELQRLYENSKERPVPWKSGDSCVAKFHEDNLWYRGLIRSVDHGKALVFFVDFGNTSWIPESSMRVIVREVASYHLLAYGCVLDDVVPNTEDGLWPVPVLSSIHEVLVNAHCAFQVTGIDEEAALLKVKVRKPEKEDWDLSTVLVEKGYAISDADLGSHYELSAKINKVLGGTNNCYMQRDAGCVGDQFKAVVTQVELPNLVYLQKLRQSEDGLTDFVLLADIDELNKGIDEFEDMMINVNSTTTMTCVELPCVGLMCLGKFFFDDRWYRAICIEQYPEQDACLLVYIDYGNSEVVTRDRMRMLPTDYLSLPALSYRCYLNLMPPSEKNQKERLWHKGSLDAMMECLSNKELVVTITQKAPLTVELRLDDQVGLESSSSPLAYQAVIDRRLALLPWQDEAQSLTLFNAAAAAAKKAADVEVEKDEVD